MPRYIGTLQVFPVGLGCLSMTPMYGSPDPAAAIATIYRAAEIGVNLLDTSDAYARGANEELVGRAIAGRRGQFLLTTKFGNLRLSDGQPSVNGRPDYVPQACEASLRRLGTDVIDLYLLHRVDPAVPIEDTVGAMSRLVEQGKVRLIGLSEAAPATLRRAHAVHPISALQSEYSLWTRDVEAELLATCREIGATFVAFSPLGRGFLTGGITDEAALGSADARRTMPRFQGENLRRNLEMLVVLERLAADERCTPAQLAIAWLLSRGPGVIPIPGTGKPGRLEENAAAAQMSLSKATLETIESVFVPTVASGTRYPAAMMARVGL